MEEASEDKDRQPTTIDFSEESYGSSVDGPGLW